MKRAPLRTCLACRRTVPKSELLRLVRGADGRIRLDTKGSAPGRGAYVHPEAACVAGSLDRGRIARALRTGSGEVGGPEELGRLRNEIAAQMGAR